MGVVLSEYAEMDPEVERVLDPALASTDGWMVYAFTPKGRNHGYQLYQFARAEVANENPRWYVDVRTVEQTTKDGPGEPGESVTPLKYIEEQRRRGYTEEFIQQEYWCSFDASLVGSYYGDQLRAAERDGRICRVVWEPSVPCITGWDLGLDDSTAIWIGQAVGRELRMLRYLEAEGEFIPYYARELKSLEYVYAEHLLPHDAAAGNIRHPLTIVQQLQSLGIRPCKVVPRDTNVEHGIQAVRALFPKMVFDEVGTRLGRERLAAYHKKQDKSTHLFTGKPEKDGSDHGADALRTLAVGLRGPAPNGLWDSRKKRPVVASMQWSPWDYERDTARRQARNWDPYGYERKE